jgi:hypothetical protein
MRFLLLLALLIVSLHAKASCTDQLIDNVRYSDEFTVPYILTSQHQSPRYVLILMPGGAGTLNPHINNEGKLQFGFAGNFLIRSRNQFCDSQFTTASTNSTESPERMSALVNDLQTRFPKSKICMVGTSRSTYSTMGLAEKFDGKIDCIIHTASMNQIARFDTRKFKSRHLMVHHKNDPCHLTTYASTQSNHERYKTPLITMEGGSSTGDACQAFSYHGFHGIEQQTIDQIKAWIRN